MSLPKSLLTQEEVAFHFGVTVRTIQRWRSDDIGPAYLQYPGKVMYLKEDVEAYEREFIRVTPRQTPHEKRMGVCA
ncbi:helix-turn-helix domain-containing protein [Teredinibacter sp. KSP-S5-2]|uniref:helix-turn-helix domain-containing protein n=1 Tax=Teredinibacter sp. KSP-S5-2 TaxID=3034506 RepID=UPI002934BD4F|nr:helix-turn-helix domain-containing protein [Teredinibacter sp. KSP-S5-2]WNO10514.1 helix-turn-helix domain-containing protein [Teredinibacter sp. KSP-S5-2]